MAQAVATQYDLHVLPQDDLVAHELSPQCMCDPEPQGTSRGWVYFHNHYTTDDDIKYITRQVGT